MSVAGSRDAGRRGHQRPGARHARAAGSGRALLEALSASEHVLVLSPFILSEVERVLNYPRMQAIWPLTPEEINVFVTELSTLAEVVQPPLERIPDVISKDPTTIPSWPRRPWVRPRFSALSTSIFIRAT